MRRRTGARRYEYQWDHAECVSTSPPPFAGSPSSPRRRPPPLSGCGPPLAGPSPLVAVAFSDAREDNLDWEHNLHNGYAGSSIFGDPARDYTVGILDTGASVDLIGRLDTIRYDITGPRLSPNFSELEGAAGQFSVPITEPLGMFAQGFHAVNDAGVLDLDQLKGHSNVAAVAITADFDESINIIPSIVGIPMLAFYNSIIRMT